jgi:hypothetical protein
MTSQTDELAESTSMMEPQAAGAPDLLDSGLHYARNGRLACEGALSLLFKASVRDVWDGLVRAGIEWEDKYTRVPAPRAAQRSEAQKS